MTKSQLNPVWDLDSIFPGASHSKEFDAHLACLETDIGAFSNDISNHQNTQNTSTISSSILRMQDIAARIREAGAFLACLNAQNVKDTAAQMLTGRLDRLRARFVAALTSLDECLLQLTDDAMQQLLCEPSMQELSFVIHERRRRANDRLSSDKESLISALSVDGYGAWGELYNTIVGRMSMTIEEDGQQKEISMGQAANKIRAANRPVREQLFAKWEDTWANEGDLCSRALNHLAGYRLSVYEARKWDSVLQEPLDVNRMSRETLDAMWGVIADNKAPFVKFLQTKARVIGTDKPTWSDVEAPLGSATKLFTYEEARDYIVHHFAQFSPEMAAFANRCFEDRWIEAEDRAGKRPGGFCTSFPVSGQTRIFVTFSGTPSNVATLAHELGHAYHQHVMRGMPQLNTNYAMNVAETASTFAEMIVADASVKAAGEADKLALLEDKVGRSVQMFMNIHARFLFETRFYEARKQGLVSVETLNELMTQAQKEAFGGVLETYHPHFWASKLHFYITGTPFYNFPYTFGYLFSTGIYAQALKEGAGFAEKYVALLRDTGSMQVEDLAQKHLGADLTKRDFWQSAVDLAVTDAHEFVRLAQVQ